MFSWGIALLSRDTLRHGVSHRCACVKLSTKGGYRTILRECYNLPVKVSRDMGYRSDSIAVSTDMGPLSRGGFEFLKMFNIHMPFFGQVLVQTFFFQILPLSTQFPCLPSFLLVFPGAALVSHSCRSLSVVFFLIFRREIWWEIWREFWGIFLTHRIKAQKSWKISEHFS